MTRLGGNQSECRSPPLERIPENAARKLWFRPHWFPSKMEEKLIISVAGFLVIYDVSLFAYRDINKKNDAWTRMFVFQREFNSFAQNNNEASKCLL